VDFGNPPEDINVTGAAANQKREKQGALLFP
jgi:hypothetical protein